MAQLHEQSEEALNHIHQIMKKAMALGSTFDERFTGDFFTGFYHAVGKYDHIHKMCTYVAELGMDIEFRDPITKRTALLELLGVRSMETNYYQTSSWVEALLHHGADVGAVDYKGR